jgi:hypothetical protein
MELQPDSVSQGSASKEESESDNTWEESDAEEESSDCSDKQDILDFDEMYGDTLFEEYED